VHCTAPTVMALARHRDYRTTRRRQGDIDGIQPR